MNDWSATARLLVLWFFVGPALLAYGRLTISSLQGRANVIAGLVAMPAVAVVGVWDLVEDHGVGTHLLALAGVWLAVGGGAWVLARGSRIAEVDADRQWIWRVRSLLLIAGLEVGLSGLGLAVYYLAAGA